MWGLEDRALGAELIADTASYAPRTQVVTVPGCSHWAQQDAVEEVVAAAAAFLSVKPQSLLPPPPLQEQPRARSKGRATGGK